MDRIDLTEIEFPCVIGIDGWERTRPQRLQVALSLGLPLDPAAGGDLGQSVDYRAVLRQLRFVAERGRFELLESLGVAVARHLLQAPGPGERRAAVQWLRLSLRKPEAWAEAGTPGIVIERDAAAAPPEEVVQGEGYLLQSLVSTPGTAVERICAEPGASLPQTLLTGGMLVAGRMSQAGRSALPLTPLQPDAGAGTIGDAGATLLRVHGPAVSGEGY